jgi:preprotein translocase subunit SecY
MVDQGNNMSDLWKRLRFVFIAILVYRIGTHIPIPGIDPDRLAALLNKIRELSLKCLICFLVEHWKG